MKLPFKVGQFIVIKWTPVESVMPTPLGLMYSSKKDSIYGVWEIQPYKFDGIKYKMHLVPYGKFAEMFLPMDRYTCDYTGMFGIKDEMIFGDPELATKFVDEFLIN